MQIAKFERDRETCKNCGNLHHVCHDPDQLWFPQRVVDWAVRQQKVADRIYEELHKALPYQNLDGTRRSAEFSSATPCRFDDGVTIIVTPEDYTPDDTFLTDPKAPLIPRGGDDVSLPDTNA